MSDLKVMVSMLGQLAYKAAAKKYGGEFAEAVVAQELQLYADGLDCFDEYAEYESFQEFIKEQKK